MGLLKNVLFVMKHRLGSRSRISANVYLKGHNNISMGQRCKIHDSASLDAGRGVLSMGDQVTVNRFAYLQADKGGVRLGNRVEVNNFSIINGTGGVVIGDNTLIGPGVRIISYQHQYAAGVLIRDQTTIAKPIHIGEDVWIGANAVIFAGVTIGDGAVIGAGAVVAKDVASNTVVAGVPARVIKTRESVSLPANTLN